MRVLMFGWEFPPHIAGGLGTACYGLTKSMAEQGCEIIFVVPKAYGDEDQSFLHVTNASDIEVPYGSLSDDKELCEKLQVIQIDSNLVPYASAEEFYRNIELQKTLSVTESQDLWQSRYNFSGKYGNNLMEEVRRYAIVAAQVAKEMEGKFDVIHAHDWLTYYAGIAAKQISGKPLVAHIHATEFDRSGKNVNPQVYAIEKAGMQAADAVCAVSNLTKKIVVEKYNVDPNRVFTIHNGVVFNTDKQAVVTKGVDDKIVTFLGRITYQKGPDYFVEAAAKVLEKVKNVRFVMAGSGDMLNHIVKRVAKLGISDRFHFTGFLKGDDVQTMFLMSDLYIMPSVSEPFGISPLEAMRAGVPVIISKQSGVAEVLENAIKVDYWDVDELANAIYSMLEYPNLTHMIKERGDKEIATITWDNAASDIIKIYNSLL